MDPQLWVKGFKHKEQTDPTLGPGFEGLRPWQASGKEMLQFSWLVLCTVPRYYTQPRFEARKKMAGLEKMKKN